MAKSLVIVESPAKAKTIGKYLGSDYIVEASVGHIMDLPKNDIGVELKKRTFEPTLIVSPGKEKVVDRLKKLAAKADAIYLAPDPDREGEAIAAHLKMQIAPAAKGIKIQRVTFNEITQKAVKAAFSHARDIDQNLMYAQQTRRVLDRLVGYQISPLLWDKVKRGLSAGRVQTVALRLIVEREREINAFNPVEYWTIDAKLSPKNDGQEFTARFVGIDGESSRVANGKDKEGKAQWLSNALPDQKLTEATVEQLKKASWSVKSVEKKERRRNPQAPFTTSKLQQDAAGRLGFNVRRTMGVAQKLYEGIEVGKDGTVGLITYMRTDSVRVSPDAITEARSYVSKKLGPQYLPASANNYKGKKDAQDAHEAIRPTHVEYTPDSIKKYLTDEQYRLYRLIWNRFVASQMTPAVFDQTSVEIAAKANKTYDFRVSGSVLKFDGYLKVYEAAKPVEKSEKKAEEESGKQSEESEDSDASLPAMEAGQALVEKGIEHQQKFTDPPPRFNEASLVKTLEELGIGRPSTYASIINTIQERDYVKKQKAKLVPTEIGMVVTELLVKNFPYIFKFDYTAQLESELDDVEDGKEKWTDLLKGFYDHFEKELVVADKNMEEIKRWEKPTTEVCEKCGSPLILKWGKFGSFFSCSNFSKAKPMSVGIGPVKKDVKAVAKKITDKLGYPLTVKGMVEDAEAFSEEVEDDKHLRDALKEAAERSKKIVIEPFSCDYTKENFADKPDLASPDAQEEQEEEYCDNCGKQMVLKNGPWGPFMSCPDYAADPPCKTIRKLNQKVQQKPPEPTGEICPECKKNELVKRQGQYGEFISCSGYPKCKYIKQTLLEVPCPKDGASIAERRTRRNTTFYGCTNYPKCDFTSNQKLVPGPCPKCKSSYLLELERKDGVFLVCPNNAEALPKRKAKAGEEPKKTALECHFEKRIADAPEPKELERPDPEKTRTLVEA